ncbi:uncharacterized protein LOC131043309 isoform X3 [Cryptomeria japonica]|uniref:uncharacterized protein LOC131043309 isoform X3 n=1 Tax=Cryptomeria japonica TaxID=3369 RepID=UPI0025AD744B|nr:uncharacterized protein LOC131043309 isoform X3 [Cryptomeria japonica]
MKVCRRRKVGGELGAMFSNEGMIQTVERDGVGTDIQPDHLLVLVHGIMASPSDWKYVEAELQRRLGNRFLIYASAGNSYTQTLHGIDIAGRRLAGEVQQLIQKTPSLRRISFLAHSLGGLFARYAIAVLYRENSEANGSSIKQVFAEKMSENKSTEVGGQYMGVSKGSSIGGLEAMNFITLATPHLGVRGKKQLPLLFGVPLLEKLAPPLAQYVIRRTGRQLFLTDGKASRPPLLLRMASDCEDGKFISALAMFKSRILYANVSFDHMVGWRTSSIRRESELVKPPTKSLDGYKHVVDVAYCPPVLTDSPSFPPETAKAKEAAQTTPYSKGATDYYDTLEEEMIRGLQRVGWKKVDVSFHSAFWPFFAHNNIHVKQEWLHYPGAGVVAHVADSLKQQEMATFISASL